MRLDIYLTTHHNIQSRNKASELIKNQKIQINGKIIIKPSFHIQDDDKVEILQEQFYVSRSAYKLKYFLEEIDIDLKDTNTLDIGSSTGGFTQILLQQDVKSVTCIDVGSNQLHDIIKNDKRIIKKENTDIREFNSSDIYDTITCDVSFISILNILKDIDKLASDNIIILYKPQFEVGSNVKRDRAGVVQDKIAIANARENFITQTIKYNWKLIYNNQSKIAGKKGNLEELFYFVK
jgi:23S rRNA (cytidine1920-2'-O)/16S rRNA (cytidine1409-2'-O)-methyltransferase